MDISNLRNSTVQFLHSRRHEIDMDPVYQRQGAIWSREKQQLLIDSLINEFDVPKIYFHQHTIPVNRDGLPKRWSLVDGKQRLEAIFGFINGEFALSDDFQYLATNDVSAASKTYTELALTHPYLVSTFNATALDVIVIRTDDHELIEEMFSRLNEAVPLNAAERRNAIGGPLRSAVLELANTNFFVERLPFSNSRYRHFDLATKFLYWSDLYLEAGEKIGRKPSSIPVRDVKKIRLDSFFREIKESEKGASRTQSALSLASDRLDDLAKTFTADDPLLTSVGMVSIYFLLALSRWADSRTLPSRTNFLKFEAERKSLKVKSDGELKSGEYEMVEFGRLSQSPNDGGALTYRLKLLDIFLTALEESEDPWTAIGAQMADLDS